MIQTSPQRPSRRHLAGLPRWTVLATAAFLLTACSGGGSDSSSTSSPASASTELMQALGVKRTTAAVDAPTTRAEAARFLTQATFGPTDADIDRVMAIGRAAWIDEQFALPATSHRASWEAADAVLRAQVPPGMGFQDQVYESFWKQAITGPDQLRQRVAFALSEIFVISSIDPSIGAQPRAMAAWLDMLGQGAFGSFRTLIENVSLHPLMGMYLTSMQNQKADPVTGRVPDENYAREVMQLFSVGLVKLNIDGTPALVNGQPVNTYSQSDIAGLARVFTGWSWACPKTDSDCFYNGVSGGASDPDKAIKPMQAYPQYHSTVSTTFLGVTIGAQRTPDPKAVMGVAMDVLAKHPNTAPFISKQLIQRLVTSNPSPQYVADVARVFQNNGSGAKGDMKAVVKAILTHAEAKTPSSTSGKIREPILRLSAYLRAFPHTSVSGSWKVGNTESTSSSLGQTPLRASSVFNFYRPGYVAPGTTSAAAGLVAPEMQLVNESSVPGYVNYMMGNLSLGVGQLQGTARDLQRDWTTELNLTPAELVTAVTGKLLYTTPSAGLVNDITDAVNSFAVPAATASNADEVLAAKRKRVNIAVLLTLTSPEFLVQK